jgi:hypothetical protein
VDEAEEDEDEEEEVVPGISGQLIPDGVGTKQAKDTEGKEPSVSQSEHQGELQNEASYFTRRKNGRRKGAQVSIMETPSKIL